MWHVCVRDMTGLTGVSRASSCSIWWCVPPACLQCWCGCGVVVVVRCDVLVLGRVFVLVGGVVLVCDVSQGVVVVCCGMFGVGCWFDVLRRCCGVSGDGVCSSGLVVMWCGLVMDVMLLIQKMKWKLIKFKSIRRFYCEKFRERIF